MPTPATPPTARTWRVDYTALDPATGTLGERRLVVEAAYLRRDGAAGPEFVELVGVDHKTVLAVAVDHVITVERLRTPAELRAHVERLTKQLAAMEAGG